MGKLRVGGQPGLHRRLVSKKDTFAASVENRKNRDVHNYKGDAGHCTDSRLSSGAVNHTRVGTGALME